MYLEPISTKPVILAMYVHNNKKFHPQPPYTSLSELQEFLLAIQL